MQLRRKKKVLSMKKIGQSRTTRATTRDLAGRSYLTSVRLHLCSTTVLADESNLERNITSSDVEYLTGRDGEKEGDGKVSKKTRKIKDKPEHHDTRSFIDKARQMTPERSGVMVDGDVDMSDIMLVFIKTSRDLLNFITRSPVDSANSPRFDSTAVKRKSEDVDHSQSKYVES